MSNNPSCDLVGHPSSLPQMQSSNEHTDKINSEHAPHTPEVNAQTHSYTHYFLRPLLHKHTHYLHLHRRPKVSKHNPSITLNSTVLLFTSHFFFSQSLEKGEKKHKSVRSKMVLLNKNFVFILARMNESFNTSLLQMCRGTDGSTHCSPSEQFFTLFAGFCADYSFLLSSKDAGSSHM